MGLGKFVETIVCEVLKIVVGIIHVMTVVGSNQWNLAITPTPSSLRVIHNGETRVRLEMRWYVSWNKCQHRLTEKWMFGFQWHPSRCKRWLLGMDSAIYPTLYRAFDYSSILGLKLSHISKPGPRRFIPWCQMNVALYSFILSANDIWVITFASK